MYPIVWGRTERGQYRSTISCKRSTPTSFVGASDTAVRNPIRIRPVTDLYQISCHIIPHDIVASIVGVGSCRIPIGSAAKTVSSFYRLRLYAASDIEEHRPEESRTRSPWDRLAAEAEPRAPAKGAEFDARTHSQMTSRLLSARSGQSAASRLGRSLSEGSLEFWWYFVDTGFVNVFKIWLPVAAAGIAGAINGWLLGLAVVLLVFGFDFTRSDQALVGVVFAGVIVATASIWMIVVYRWVARRHRLKQHAISMD